MFINHPTTLYVWWILMTPAFVNSMEWGAKQDHCQRKDHIKCQEEPSRCYTQKLRCDGVFDCPDGSDEAACGSRKRRLAEEEQEHDHCALGIAVPCGSVVTECYLPVSRCDGIPDCPNRADEIDCDQHVDPGNPHIDGDNEG